MHFTEEIYIPPIGPRPTTMILNILISLLLQHNDFAHLLSLFGMVVFPLKGIHSFIKL